MHLFTFSSQGSSCSSPTYLLISISAFFYPTLLRGCQESTGYQIFVISSLSAHLHPYLPLFVTIRHCSRLFVTIRNYSPLFATIRTIRYSRLFAVRYSRLFAIRYSGFPDTPLVLLLGSQLTPVHCWLLFGSQLLSDDRK